MTVVSVDLAYSDYRDFDMIALDDESSGATLPPLLMALRQFHHFTHDYLRLASVGP